MQLKGELDFCQFLFGSVLIAKNFNSTLPHFFIKKRK